MSVGEKLARLREWIRQQRPSMPSYSKAEPKPSQMQVATLVDDGHLSPDSAPHAPPWPPMARRLPSTIPICTIRLP